MGVVGTLVIAVVAGNGVGLACLLDCCCLVCLDSASDDSSFELDELFDVELDEDDEVLSSSESESSESSSPELESDRRVSFKIKRYTNYCVYSGE